MNLHSIKKRVQHISSIKADDEAAHSAEDDLYKDVLEAIANGDLKGRAARDAAYEALKTKQISFHRWCG